LAIQVRLAKAGWRASKSFRWMSIEETPAGSGVYLDAATERVSESSLPDVTPELMVISQAQH